LLALLQGQLDSQLWTVLADIGVDAGPETLRYPDVMVERAGGSARDYTTTAPALVAEVLSPSTAKVDLGDKAAEYLRLTSLMTYLVVELNEYKAHIWTREYKAHIWTREADGFPPAPTVIRGRDQDPADRGPQSDPAARRRLCGRRIRLNEPRSQKGPPVARRPFRRA